MTATQTFNILKYGYMDQSCAKDIISDYFEQIQLERSEYWSGWENVDSDFCGYTHFMLFDIKNIDGKIIIEIVSRQDDSVKHVIDITELTPIEVLDSFSSYYEELHKELRWQEYQENFPDDDFEQ